MKASAAEKVAQREQDRINFMDDRAAKRAREQAEKDAERMEADPLGKGMPNIDKVEEVGKIRDNVDISSEDLKTMRELAEMKTSRTL